MSAEWITFEELCERVPHRSPRTLRRMIAARQISYRRLTRRGRLDFNWAVVQRELAASERHGVNAPAEPLPVSQSALVSLQKDVHFLTHVVFALAEKAGVPVSTPETHHAHAR